MIKFSQLSIGQHFLFRGIEHTKSGPLQAIEKATGGEKMIMRSAAVELLKAESSPTTSTVSHGAQTLGHLRKTVDTYHRHCQSLLETTEHQSELEQLESQYQEIQRSIDALLTALAVQSSPLK